MKYPYLVKFKGRLYNAGEDVPNDDISEVKAEKEEVKKEVVEESATPSLSVEEKPQKTYTLNAIRKMKHEELIRVCTELGFNDAEDFTAAELKRNLIQFFKL